MTAIGKSTYPARIISLQPSIAGRAKHHGSLTPVEHTCRITAGFRAVEQRQHAQPIIHDPLAAHLAGAAALQLAEQEWAKLTGLQGPGKHLRVPARNRILDDEVLRVVTDLGVSYKGGIQVVNIGCGMDTRPWRLAFPAGVTYFDVDQPAVIQLKQQLLQQAGAQLVASTTAAAEQPQTTQAQQAQQQQVHAGEPPQLGQQVPAQQQQQQRDGVSQYPLLVSHYAAVAADLSQQRLTTVLAAAGWRPETPTIWVAEALLYYLTLRQAVDLLQDMAAGSAQGSRLLATVVDRELYEVDQKLQDGHYFAKMWQFCIDDLVGAGGQQLCGRHVGSRASSNVLIDTVAGGGQLQAAGACPCSRGTAAPIQVDAAAGDNVHKGPEGQQLTPARALGAHASVLQRSGWELRFGPKTTADLAQNWYGMATYAADYGGAECYFSAALAGR